MGINKDILRWVLLLGAMPIWLPFLRILWKDFNRALEEEGGIFGRAPNARDRERIRRERMHEPDPLVSEPWARRGEPRAPAARRHGGGPAPSGERGGGFRSSGERSSTSVPRAGSPRPNRPEGSSGSSGGFRANPRHDRESGRGFR